MSESLADFVRRIMKDKDLTYTQVEESSGGVIKGGHLADIIQGRNKNLQQKTLRALAAGLNLEIEEVLQVAFDLKPLADDPFVQEFMMIGKKYSLLDERHRRGPNRFKALLIAEIEDQLKHQHGLIDDYGDPTTGVREGTNGA